MFTWTLLLASRSSRVPSREFSCSLFTLMQKNKTKHRSLSLPSLHRSLSLSSLSSSSFLLTLSVGGHHGYQNCDPDPTILNCQNDPNHCRIDIMVGLCRIILISIFTLFLIESKILRSLIRSYNPIHETLSLILCGILILTTLIRRRACRLMALNV